MIHSRLARVIPVLICLAAASRLPSQEERRNTPPGLRLSAPAPNQRIEDGPVQFRWEYDPGTFAIAAKSFEFRIEDSRKNFQRLESVAKTDGSGPDGFRFDDIRSVLRRHGRYRWTVTALDSAGNPVAQAKQWFLIQVPNLSGAEPAASPQTFRYSFRFQGRHWSDLAGYRSLLDQASPKTHLEGHGEIGIGFHQRWTPSRRVEMSEHIVFLTNIGIGLELGPRVRIVENRYFALSPWVRTRYGWASTGIGHRTSRLAEAATGLDVAMLPTGNLVFTAGWIPLHRIEYGLLSGGPAVVNGWGYEAGVRICFPRTLMGTPAMLGGGFDYRRIPITFTAGSLKDRNTGKRLLFQKIGIEYLF
jgi:hypothetical protein